MTLDIEAKRDFKNRLYGEFARIVLAQGERTVESIAAETGLSVANTSRHLQQLRQAQLVAARRDGLFVHYRLSGPEVVGSGAGAETDRRATPGGGRSHGA